MLEVVEVDAIECSVTRDDRDDEHEVMAELYIFIVKHSVLHELLMFHDDYDETAQHEYLFHDDFD